MEAALCGEWIGKASRSYIVTARCCYRVDRLVDAYISPLYRSSKLQNDLYPHQCNQLEVTFPLKPSRFRSFHARKRATKSITTISFLTNKSTRKTISSPLEKKKTHKEESEATIRSRRLVSSTYLIDRHAQTARNAHPKYTRMQRLRRERPIKKRRRETLEKQHTRLIQWKLRQPPLEKVFHIQQQRRRIIP